MAGSKKGHVRLEPRTPADLLAIEDRLRKAGGYLQAAREKMAANKMESVDLMLGQMNGSANKSVEFALAIFQAVEAAEIKQSVNAMVSKKRK